MPLTRSKASALQQAAPPQQATATEEDVVTINWIFFDKSLPDKCRPLGIDVPRARFKGRSQNCMRLFASEILDSLSLSARQNTVEFWKPKELTLIDTVIQKGWIEGINEIQDVFEVFPLTRSFAKGLESDIDNDEALHLAVTATASPVKEDSDHEGDDLANELPEIQRYQKIVSTPGKSPSAGAKSKDYAEGQALEYQAIHDGRLPPNPKFFTVAPPVQIYHPIFDQFTQLLSDPSVQPTNNDIKQAQDLMHSLSYIGTNETSRNAMIRGKLRQILEVDFRQETNDDGTSPDAIYMFLVNGFRIPLSHAEFKREIGEGASDPSTQAGLSMKRAWIQAAQKEIREKSCCPTLMLVGGGPWLGVLGGVFTDKVIVQRLTDLMWCAHSTTEEDPRVYRLARVLVALRRSIHELENFYKDISDPKNPALTPGQPHPRFYPYPTSFTENGKTVHFKYTRILEKDATCVAFQAKISHPVDDSSPDIVVKFVTRYGTDVHEFLASEDHAPRLRYCGPLSGVNDEQSPVLPSSQQSPVLSLGPMQMIVMDYVSHRGVTPPDAVQQIEAVLYKLHCKGYVFGDLRGQNILFDEDGKVKFIDFDWSGRYDMSVPDQSLPADLQKRINDEQKNIKSVDHYVCYPLNLSLGIPWAPGARDLEPIRPEHDWFMLRQFPS